MSNEWFERGELPPIGIQVAVTLEKRYKSAEVCGTFCDYVWVRYEDEAMPESVHKMYVRPIKTDKEKAIEAALSVMSTKTISNTQRKTINKLYDAGLLRLPEDKK